MCKAKQNAKPSAAKQIDVSISSIAKPLQVLASDLYMCIVLLFSSNEMLPDTSCCGMKTRADF